MQEMHLKTFQQRLRNVFLFAQDKRRVIAVSRIQSERDFPILSSTNNFLVSRFGVLRFEDSSIYRKKKNSFPRDLHILLCRLSRNLPSSAEYSSSVTGAQHP